MYDPQLLSQQLNEKAEEAEMESDNIATDFLNGDMTLADFTKKYISFRELYHTRQSKAKQLYRG